MLNAQVKRISLTVALTSSFMMSPWGSARAAESRGDAAKLGIEWISIPGGSFTMGSDEAPNPAAVYQDGPAHRVTLKTFQMAKTLVTNKQYQACVDADVCLPAHYLDGTCSYGRISRDFPKGFDGPEQPVICLDWDQARVFAEWIGARLPTESEWEYAARSAGKNWAYPWGSQEATCSRAVVSEDVFKFGCGRSATWPVCSKPKGNTKQGLCDMAGNIGQWVQDVPTSYRPDPSDGSPPPDTLHSPFHVYRGGACDMPGRFARSTHRFASGLNDNSMGFRPARTAP